MQLDKTRIVVRERNYLDLLDLALCVIRAHGLPLVATTALGVAPMILLNVLLVGDRLTDLDVELGTDVVPFVWTLVLLFLLEAPLAAAPTTLYLGQALFLERPEPLRIARDFLGSLPQLVLFLVGPRAVLVLPAVITESEVWLALGSVCLMGLAFLHYAFWPHLGEVILLDRNPIFRRKQLGMNTLRRTLDLHRRNAGDLFGRWILFGLLGGAWIVALWLATEVVIAALLGRAELGVAFYTIYLQVVVWLVVSFFTVVRFLGYLDLRIKNEGWEIELKMRAEAARLTRPLA